MAEDNGKQDLKNSYTNKYQKHIACSCGYKLVCVDDNYNINLKLNLKILVVFHNLKHYDSHLIMQELDKFNLKINFIPDRLEKNMSFTINKKLSFYW